MNYFNQDGHYDFKKFNVITQIFTKILTKRAKNEFGRILYKANHTINVSRAILNLF